MLIDWDKFYSEQQAKLEEELNIGDFVEYAFTVIFSKEKECTISGIGRVCMVRSNHITLAIEEVYPMEDKLYEEAISVYPVGNSISLPRSHDKFCSQFRHISRVVKRSHRTPWI